MTQATARETIALVPSRRPRACWLATAAASALLLGGGGALAQTAPADPPMRRDASELARQSQNPISNMISLPFQNNTNFNVGPNNGTQNVLNIQPVIPISLSPDWNLITRTIFPLISQPEFVPGQGRTFGLGATTFSAWLSPANSANGITWGVGGAVQLPSTTDQALGSNIWGAGPTAVALISRGPWVAGALANNIWSFGGGPHNSYNNFLAQPFVNYNIPDHPGLYLQTSPIITANWEARSGQQWTVPVGMAVGKVFHIGNQAINASLGGYYNVVRPDFGPEWQVRAQFIFLFPE